MRAEVGYSDIPDSAAAGRQAAEQAVGAAGKTGPCDLVLLFATARHDERILREAVAGVVGASVPVYGGGAMGIITNDRYGYAGDQVGVACIWLEGVRCDAVIEGGLLESEKETGFRLGRGLSGLGTTPESPVMLFYGAVARNDNAGIRMLMATWLLEGMEKALGFLPDLAGAGLMGDHAGRPTRQYAGGDVAEHAALALAFGGDIRMDSVVMHGCRPASAYYTVTKAEGPVILEINHTPALTFMDSLIGPAVKPEQYPFFLVFGINSGDRWGEYDEEQYASRLCLGIDRERGGIVMFEPDMVEGVEFQLMQRSFDLDYMRPKFESAFSNLRGRKPVFALYIDCGGRCAGYGGTDVEDALALQQAVAGRVPALGIYTGVEIGPVAGRPRGLDLTGVFCLFSQGEGDGSEPAARAGPEKAVPQPQLQPQLRTRTAPDVPVAFLSGLCEQNAARALALDTQVSALRYELELKRRGFALLSELAIFLRRMEDDRDASMQKDVFIQVAQRINAALNMQKTVVLLANGEGEFAPAVLQGFTPGEQARLRERAVRLEDELLRLCPAVVSSAGAPECFERLRGEYELPFFVVSPMYLQGEAAAVLLTGRMVEEDPYFTRLGNGDLETVHAVTELLASALVRLRLQDVTAQVRTDGLTGLWNRNAFQHMVESHLRDNEQQRGAFMMIDMDHFKSVNDTYGHMAGDNLLKACAAAMRSVLRDSDIVGRLGGDEFVVFCKNIRDETVAEAKAAQIAGAWGSLVPDGGTKPVTASIGISLSPRHGALFQELYIKADAALYKAKERGRNRFVVFNPETPRSSHISRRIMRAAP